MMQTVATTPIVQTMLFQQASIDAKQRQYAYLNPVQFVMASEFPTVFNLFLVTAVYGTSKGILSCNFTIEMDGVELLRHEHSPIAIDTDGAGASFNLSLQQIVIRQPGELIIKTRLSNGIRGADIRLPILAQERVQAD